MANALPDRYRSLEDHADCGLGADEFEGARRYTRPTDRGRISNAPLDARKAPDDSTAKRTSEAFTTNQPTTRQER